MPHVRSSSIPLLTLIGLTIPMLPCQTQIRSIKSDSNLAIRHVRNLASDSMQGRDTGTEGFEKSAAYVVSQFTALGLVGIQENRSYIQEFPFPYYESGRHLPSLVIGKRRFQAADRDFSILEYSGGGKVKGEVVFVGYGISDSKNRFDEYQDLDVHGKIVLVMHGGPDGYERISKSALTDSGKAAVAMRKRALGMLLCSDFREEQTAIGRWSLVPGIYDKDFIAFGVDERVFRFLMKKTGETDRAFRKQWRREKDALDRERKICSGPTGKTAVLEADVVFDPSMIGKNVIGVIPGTDPERKEEVVIVGGHLDHEGIRYGEIYNGADDNASGVAVVIETARRILQGGTGPGRTVVFACWGGEERGLLGSTYYVRNPIFPLEKTVAYLNLDMVGQGSSVRFSGVYLAPTLWDVIARKIDNDLFRFTEPGRGGLGGSDHTPFLLKGVPGFFLITTGKDAHPDYHTPEDDPETINAGLLDRVSNLVEKTAMILADEDSDLIPEDRFAAIRYKLAYVAVTDPIVFEPESAPLDSIHSPCVDLQWLVLSKPPMETDPDRSYARFIRSLNVFQMRKEKIGAGRRDAGSAFQERTEFLVGIRSTESNPMSLPELRGLVRSGLEFFVFETAGGHWLTADGGVTDEGREAIEELNRGNVLVMTRNVPIRAIQEILRLSKQPVLVSGIDDLDVLDSAMIDSLKEHKAVVGLIYCAGSDPKEWIHKANKFKDRSLLLQVTVDLRKEPSAKTTESGDLFVLSKALRQAGYSEDDIEGVLGRNLRGILPQRQTDRRRSR